jgi:hypothetical protein
VAYQLDGATDWRDAAILPSHEKKQYLAVRGTSPNACEGVTVVVDFDAESSIAFVEDQYGFFDGLYIQRASVTPLQ